MEHSNYPFMKKTLESAKSVRKSSILQNTCIAPNSFIVVAILKFKMVIQSVLVTFGTNNVWIQHSKLIKIGQNQFWSTKSQNMAP